MTDSIAALGRTTINALTVFGRAFIFLIRMLASLDIVFRRFGLTLVQVYSVGVRSLLIIVVSGLFVGMVLAYQGYITLVNFGAAEALGGVVALSLVRELGPVVTALLFAGRAGSALTAELGLMKTTEQLSAMEMMAVNPYRRIFAPRFVAGFLSMPLLAAIFSAVGVMGGYLVGVGLLGVDSGAYFSQMQSVTDWNEDVLSGVIKSIVFGFVVTWIAVFQGFNAQPTSEGISRATTQTVVVSSLAVLGLDFILTGLMFGAG
ncbi:MULTISPECIES: lipid asymmetry maintenance ABC transporter permease subunit MlaE [Thioalkalivibrio]|uniref:Intermembrane phospholipid transport system permease protein MlaE n=1 Tax=Thioalkalivibrio versutus TaxID=106634 RepID=A0A0G3G3Z0_9GAMM|nr:MULTISPECIES: lipid asymmetry maintenance ABC transporter permease subunit MlaE [Thioalkalivibrio]AKJ94207.1 ABC transporter permease [Thioalkalivibrio versutus]OOC49495.1 ABC transporter permease [Thioalkalivibrio versutus]